jgi:hypothetical protein
MSTSLVRLVCTVSLIAAAVPASSASRFDDPVMERNGASAQTADRRPAVEVVVDNHAASAAGELTTARARARFMFDDAGIQLIFPTRRYDSGGVTVGAGRIHVVVLDTAAAERLIASDGRRLAFAVPAANRVYVHYDRVHALARAHRAEPGWFLGVVIAHELAHVLLPRAGHADAGVMAGMLSPDPRMAPAFTPREAQQLRARLRLDTMLARR